MINIEHYPMNDENISERKKQVYRLFGKTVDVVIDRPIGAVHPKHSDLIYPINYGYIEGEIAPDGEGIDVYILGEDKPLERFRGRIIGIIHRENDIEDKLVAAAPGKVYNQAEIAELTDFQEKYYKTKVDSLYHRSAGMIVYRVCGGKIEYLVIYQKKSRTHSFPKGHLEAGENDKSAAIREVYEEIGQRLCPIGGFCESISYHIPPLYEKTVVLYLARLNGEISPQAEEVGDYCFAEYGRALELLNNPEYKRILENAEKAIKETENL